jgi:hypothetical protein
MQLGLIVFKSNFTASFTVLQLTILKITNCKTMEIHTHISHICYCKYLNWPRSDLKYLYPSA